MSMKDLSPPFLPMCLFGATYCAKFVAATAKLGWPPKSVPLSLRYYVHFDQRSAEHVEHASI